MKQILDEERNIREEELKQKTYTCLICFTDLKIEEMYTLDECNHRYCFECLKGFFISKINDGHTRNIHCPQTNCKHIIGYAEIKHCVDKHAFDKYEKFLLQATLKDDPNARWCPKPGCGTAMLINPRGGSMLICPNATCKFTFCFKCMEEWHSDATCEQYKQWKIENNETESRFATWAASHTQNCPKCSAKIEKNGGCNHMTCVQCNHDFCWLCLADYDGGKHFDVSEGCDQFS